MVQDVENIESAVPGKKVIELEQNDLNKLARHAKIAEGRDIPEIFRLLTSLGCPGRATNEAIASIPGVVNIADELWTACLHDESGSE